MALSHLDLDTVVRELSIWTREVATNANEAV